MTSPQISQTGILELITHAGLMAKLVMTLLLGLSILCWAVIVEKWKNLGIAVKQNEKFMAVFWNGKNIEEILSKSEKLTYSPAAAAFKSAVKELRKISGSGEPQSNLKPDKIDNIHRALVRASSQEISAMEKHLGWLATTASAAPFIGLFGTVWGIMNSFQSIGATGAANLAVVAPGISEALITTATGIGAAIPAVIAYNYFIGQVKRISTDLECFCQDFINIVQRSFTHGKGDH